MASNLKVFFLICCVLKTSMASSGDGEIEFEYGIVENFQEKSVNNDYKEMTTIFDPFWLANLWPQLRNGAHLLLDAACSKDLTEYFESVLEGKIWTLRAIDSTGHFKNGLFWGNEFWIGSKEECMNMDYDYMNLFNNPSESQIINNVENILNIAEYLPPYRLSYSILQIMFNITKLTYRSSSKVFLGICLPRSCQSSDIHHLIEFSMNTYQTLKVTGTVPRAVKILGVRVVNGEYTPYGDPFFYILCSMSILVAAFTLIGTIVDSRDETITTVEEEDTAVLKPKFRQLSKSDISEPIIFIQDSSKSMNFNNNKMTIDNNTNDFVFGSPKKSMESIFTVDGLIQNKFSDNYNNSIRNDNFFNMQKFSINIFNEQENLKAKKACKRNKQSSLKKRKISTDNGTMLSDHRCKKQKYVLSSEEPTFAGRIVDEIKSIECFQDMKCIDKNSTFADILMCFSVKKNLKNILRLEVTDDNLSCIHGLRILSLFWVIFIQTALTHFYFSDNKTGIQKYVSQIVGYSTYAVDTFFVLSGLLASYSISNILKNSCSEENVGFGGAIGSISSYMDLLVRRYLRFIFPYVTVLCLTALCSKYFYAHGVLESPDLDNETCYENWWRNLLYLNTFYPFRDMCIQSSWYITTETQFYAAAILILILSTKCPKISVMIISIVLLAAWSIGALVTLRGHDNIVEWSVPSNILEDIFDKPWLRVDPYITGLGTGWLLCKTNCCMVVSKTTSFSLWLLSILALLSPSYGLYDIHSEQDFSVFSTSSILYYTSVAWVVIGHTAWGMAVAWIVLACVTGYGGAVKSILSLRFLFPLSRLSYSIYLLYPLILKITYISAGMVQHFSTGILMVYYLGLLVITLVSSLLFSLLFESPVISLLKLSRTNQKTYSDDDS